MLNVGFDTLRSIWTLWLSAAPYIALGLSIAALLKAFVPAGFIAKQLGRRQHGDVLRAAFLGMPLPLCSCSVLPTAISLHRQGASKPATMSFLVSTPESGVDSISLTYGMLGPEMAIIRPLAGIISGWAAGALELMFGNATIRETVKPCCADHAATTPEKTKLSTKVGQGLRYAFGPLLRDLTPTLALGVLLGGILSVLIPDHFIHQYFGSGLGGKLIMLVVGIPMYVCASASTPLAAAMIMKGMSPGTALVFLLAGPATNLTSLPVLAKQLGWRSVGMYLCSIALCAIAFGYLVDLCLPGLTLSTLATHAHEQASPLGLIITILMSAWMLWNLRPQRSS